MKLSYRNRNIILLCIAFLLLALPVFKVIFKIKIDEEILKYIGNGLFMVAILIYFVGKKRKS